MDDSESEQSEEFGELESVDGINEADIDLDTDVTEKVPSVSRRQFVAGMGGLGVAALGYLGYRREKRSIESVKPNGDGVPQDGELRWFVEQELTVVSMRRVKNTVTLTYKSDASSIPQVVSEMGVVTKAYLRLRKHGYKVDRVNVKVVNPYKEYDSYYIRGAWVDAYLSGRVGKRALMTQVYRTTGYGDGDGNPTNETTNNTTTNDTASNRTVSTANSTETQDSLTE